MSKTNFPFIVLHVEKRRVYLQNLWQLADEKILWPLGGRDKSSRDLSVATRIRGHVVLLPSTLN